MQPLQLPPPLCAKCEPRRVVEEMRRLSEGAPALAPARTRRGDGRAPARPRPLAPGMHAIRPFPPDRVGTASLAVLGVPRHLARDVPDEAPRAGEARLAHQVGVPVAAGAAP